jgi:uncharacterized membrane protein YebE (DUF533 family)
MRIAHLITAAALAALSVNAAAQTPSTPRIDQRQENQATRIEKGQASGQLNKREARRLDKGQQRVQKMEDAAAADGKITARERVGIEKAQDRQSRRIARQKHDRQQAKK